MTARVYGWLLLLFVFCQTMHPLGYRRLVCLFDPHAVELPSNQNFALMIALLNAVREQSAPILVSPSLWNNFIVRKYRFEKLSAPGPIEMEQVINFVKDLFKVHGPFVMGAEYKNQDTYAFTRKIATLYRTYFEYYKNLSSMLRTFENVNAATFVNPSFFDRHRTALLDNFSAKKLQTPPELNPDLEKNLFRKDITIDFLCYMTPFKTSEWIVRQQKDLTGNVTFYVLFPQRYFDKLGADESTVEFINRFIRSGEHGKGWDSEVEFERYISRGGFITKNGFLTKRELLTGVKLDALQDASLTIQDPRPYDTIKGVSLANYNFIDLFVTRRDLDIFKFVPRPGLLSEEERSREELLVQWIIAAYGHGAIEPITQRRKLIEHIRQQGINPRDAQAQIKNIENEIQLIQQQGEAGGIVVGLRENEFFKFLDFLNQMVNARFLFYETCYGGGMHARFEWVTTVGVLPSKSLIRSYGYTLASGALTDAFSTRKVEYIVVPPLSIDQLGGFEITRGKGLRLKSLDTNNQTLFFYGMERFFDGDRVIGKSKKEETIAQIINYIHTFMGGADFEFIGNIPLIRFPYTEWMRVSEVEKRVVRLTAVKVRTLYAKALIQNKPPVWNFAQPSVVLIWPLKIPLILRLNNKAPTFVSMVGGEVTHVIEELQAPGLNATEVFGAFFRIGGMEYEKIFIMNKMLVNLDIPTIPKKGKTVLSSCIVGFNIHYLNATQAKPLNVIYFMLNNDHYLATWDPQGHDVDFKNKKLPQFRKLTMNNAQDAELINNLKRKIEKAKISNETERKSLMEYDLTALARFVLQREATKKNLMMSYLSLRSNQQAFNVWKRKLSPQEQKIINSFEIAESKNIVENITRLNTLLNSLSCTLTPCL